jgi:hypothetical protein
MEHPGRSVRMRLVRHGVHYAIDKIGQDNGLWFKQSVRHPT